MQDPTPPPKASPQQRSALPRDYDPDVGAAELDALVAGDRAFAADLYRRLAATPGSLAVSPYSISTALRMTYAGAGGDTQAQMASTLRFTLPAPALHAAANRLALDLGTRGGIALPRYWGDAAPPLELTVVNGIWAQQDAPFEAPFLDTMAVHYDAGVYLADFAGDPEASRQTINAWVEANTAGRIAELIEKLAEDTWMVLTNVIYFRAPWATPFAAERTAPGAFTTADGVVEVATMRSTAAYGHAVGPRFRAVELPYHGDDLSMVVVVPEPVDSAVDPLTAFEADLTGDTLAAIVASLEPAYLALALPSFEIGQAIKPKGALIAMGMEAPFVPYVADFDGIANGQELFIGDLLHQAFVHVDEAGTEAAAATATVTLLPPIELPPPTPFALDRPFLFFILDRPTGAILFLGRVVDPR